MHAILVLDFKKKIANGLLVLLPHSVLSEHDITIAKVYVSCQQQYGSIPHNIMFLYRNGRCAPKHHREA